ncbi:hypothetical protein CNR22_18625 [Sphingobacteriaceae bacterium]|nr:hypothetical protein CNR22_18625 [Sphingobacteriaceae bacterium]
MIDHLAVFIILALLAEVLGTVGGFGSSLFFVPLAGYFLDFHTVLGVTAVFHVFSNISKISLFRQGFNKQLIITVGIPAVLFVILGAYLTRFFNSSILQLVLSGFLIAISSLFLFIKNLKVKPTTFNSITGGALSGLTAGLLGSGGAIRGLTLAAFSIEKSAFIATSAVIDLGVDLSRSVVYFSNGYIQAKDLYLIGILFFVSFAGTYLGKKILRYFSESQFRYFTLSLILIIGVVSLAHEI